MRTRPVILVLFLAFVAGILLDATALGVQAEFKDRFVGRWESDMEKTKKYAREHEEAEKYPDGFLDNMPKFRFEFLASGAATAAMDNPPVGEPQIMKGDWKLVEEIDENHAKVRIMMKVDGEEDAKVAIVEFVDDDTCAITVDEQPTLVFARSVDESKKNDKSSSDKKII